MDAYYGYSQPRSYGPWDHNQGAPYSAQRGRATSEFMMPGGGYMCNNWRNSSADHYAYGNYQNQWSHDEFQWSGPPHEQPYPSSNYYEPPYADRDHYYSPYPYNDPHEYQPPPQEYTQPSKYIEDMFNAIMGKSEQHEHTMQRIQQSLKESSQYIQDALSKISEHVAEEISLESEPVEEEMTIHSGEKIVLEDEETMMPAGKEGQELTTMVVGDAGLEMEDLPTEHTEIFIPLEEPVFTTPVEAIDFIEQFEFPIVEVVSHPEEKEHDCYTIDAYEDPFLYSFEEEKLTDFHDILFAAEDPEITMVEERIELEIEVIPTMNLTKQVEFEIFEVASYHEEKERDCYILDVIPDPTLIIEPRHDVFYMTDTKAYQKARCFMIHDKLRKMMSRLWPKARRTTLGLVHEFYRFYHIPYNDPRCILSF